MGILHTGNGFFKPFVFLVLIATLISFSACKKKKERWYNFAPDGEKFSLDFPQKPIESKNLKRMPWGDLFMHTISSNPNDDDDHNLKYTIIYTNYPEASPIKPTNSPGRNKEILTKMMQDAVDASEGKLRSTHDQEIDGAIYKDFIVDIMSKSNVATTVSHRFILSRNSLYMMEVTSKRGEEKNDATDRFFSSIALQ